MKNSLFTLFFTLFCLVLHSQEGNTIQYEDDGALPIELTWQSSSGTPERNTYSGGDVIVSWNNNRWEIRLTNGDLLFFNTSTFAPNPPSGTGGWSNPGGVNLLNFSGTGTQSTQPVHLIAFEGKEGDNNSIVLLWTTASEIDNKGFFVQKSNDGIQFKNIGFVDGRGDSSTKVEYTYEDLNNVPGQLYYYRLHQIDYDGTNSFSPIVSLSIGINGASLGSLYPNPSKTGMVNLSYTSLNDNNSVRVAVYDALGRNVFQKDRTVSKGQNNLEFNFSSLVKGIYSVSILDNNKQSTYRLILE